MMLKSFAMGFAIVALTVFAVTVWLPVKLIGVAVRQAERWLQA